MQRKATSAPSPPNPSLRSLCHPARSHRGDLRPEREGGGRKICKRERKIKEGGRREAEDDCQRQHDVEGKDLWLTGTVLRSFLPTSSQPEMRTAWGTSSRRVNCCLPLPSGPELERGPPCSACCPKAGFQEGWAMNRATLVLGNEQEGLCRPRIPVRLLISAATEKSRVRSTTRQALLSGRCWTRVPSDSAPLWGG